MTRYHALTYYIPPSQMGRPVEMSYAFTRDELVRRTEDTRTGAVTFETIDLCEVSGKIEPQKRTPSAPRAGWTRVDGNDLTPA